MIGLTDAHSLSYQCLDNVNKYAKFDQNIPCSSRFMSTLTKRPPLTKVMLGEALSPSRILDVAHSIGVQNVVLPFFCLQEPIHDVLVNFFCFETRGVRSPC